jgi:hypothetical protein
VNVTRRSALFARGSEPQPFQVLVDLNSERGWQHVDAATVFTAGQEIRFRIRSAIPGYVYLLDETPLGEQNWIYPEPEGTVRRLLANREYTIPAHGVYRVSAQPGYDILYWVVSPVRLSAVPQLPLRPQRRPAGKLLPRCQDSVLRARGLCTDEQAGSARPAQSATAAELAKQIAGGTGSEPGQDGAAVLTSSGNVVIYEMRLAHK